MRRTPRSDRGSALLIVLGLLGFLLISAVAFAISMRTEKSAAASYRTGLQARELLATVFSEARYAVDAALSEQFEDDGDPLTDASVRTAYKLAPFRYSNDGTENDPDEIHRYARVMASRDDDGNEESIAYLLDDAVLRHVPPAFAYAVYEALENNDDPVSKDYNNSRSRMYNFDHCANWKQLKVATPTREVSVSGKTEKVHEEVVGRMAWAVVNLSDSLDINAVGSFSPKRGIGLTASEFAFNTDGEDDYALFEENVNAEGLPLFASGADLALYAARATSSGYLWRGTGGFFPYSWENAIDAAGQDAYSPFTVYSFWPDVGRETESGKTLSQTTSSGGGSVETIACNEVNTDSNLLSPGSKLQSYFGTEEALRDNAAADSLVQMLMDYLDEDTVPSTYENAPSQEAYNNAIPTVEPVPMLSEIGYTDADWKSGAAFEKDLEDALTKALDGKKSKAVQDINELKTLNVDKELTLELPAASLTAALRTYFPGCAESEQGDTLFQLEGFAIGYAALAEGEGESAVPKADAVTGAAKAAPFTTADALTVPGGEDPGENIYEVSPNVKLTANGAIGSYTIEGTKIAMTAPSVGGGGQGGQGGGSGGGSSTASQVTLNLLVDFVFRVKATSGGTVVDLCPAGKGYSTPPSVEGADYPATLALRQNANQMSAYDGNFFRVSRTLTATFYLSWADVQGAGTAEDPYTATTKVENFTFDFKPKHCKLTDEIDLVPATAESAADKDSYQVASPASGTWFTIDPRYNWLSPMKGVSDSDANYGLASGNDDFLAAFSSPHWLFYKDATVETSSSAASVVQQAYAEAHNGEGGGDDTALVPFSWGLEPQDVRYGYNNSGQLLLPEELGLLPVPYTRNDWTPTGTFDDVGYREASLQSYYDTVGKASFYRTLPVADFDDGAFSEADYTRMVNLTTRFGRFGGKNFPEEHRGIVNAFAGMDDYTYGQRLKQFAMLGIPGTIAKAAANTYTRLQEAVDAARVSDQMLADLDVLKPDDAQGGGSDEASTTSKYDDFVRDYLFPVDANGRGEVGGDSWEKDYVLAEADENGQQVTGRPTRPTTLKDVILQKDAEVSLTSKLQGYNGKHDGDKLGQNDLTTLVAVGNSCFGDRQQLFLYILRADTINYSSNRDLAGHKPQTTARAVALVWRDAYGELPDRVVYFQYLP